MKHNHQFYGFLIIILIISFSVAFLLPTSDIIKGIAATPGISALFIALYQLLRDQSLHEKQLELQRRQQIFNLGATSHMANTAFDKHVEFCEKYMAEVHNTVSTLFREGPSGNALDHSGNLFSLRQEYSAWLTEDIATKLEPFEAALRRIGASSQFIETTSGSGSYAESRSKKIDEMYRIFRDMLGLEEKKEKIDEAFAVETVKSKIRDILGIEQLTLLRKALISEASKLLQSEQPDT